VKSAGFKPPAGGAVATNWHNWGVSAPASEINAPGEHFGSLVGTYWHGRYAGRQGQLLKPGEIGGHVMTIVPGTYDPKGNTAMFADQYGVRRRSLTDIDIRAAGKQAAGLPNGSQVGPGTGAGAGETPAGSPSEYLARQRAGFGAELKDPATAKLFADVIAHEGGTVEEKQAVAEAAMNRSIFEHHSLLKDIHSGFFGPVNRGEVTGNISGAKLAGSQEAIRRALAGSNIVHGATDQGMLREIHSAWREKHGDYYGDISPKAADWRKRQQLEAMTHKVEGSGTIDVNVNAPRGTFVKAAGRGMFKSTKINRQMQMEKAASSVPYEE
jgi:hypothetical protein